VSIAESQLFQHSNVKLGLRLLPTKAKQIITFQDRRVVPMTRPTWCMLALPAILKNQILCHKARNGNCLECSRNREG
jgi:hypothetical protein